MVSPSMPPALSWMMMVPGSTVTAISGATSASSQASNALSISSLQITVGHS